MFVLVFLHPCNKNLKSIPVPPQNFTFNVQLLNLFQISSHFYSVLFLRKENDLGA